jgi:hypothetical protein
VASSWDKDVGCQREEAVRREEGASPCLEAGRKNFVAARRSETDFRRCRGRPAEFCQGSR